MMRRNRLSQKRGLSLLELLLALTVTAMVAGAIAGMLGAVSAGVGSRKDNRTLMVLANAAQGRLAGYLSVAQCMLASDGVNLTIWLDDSRESGTVHATEVRWLRFDADAGALVVDYVDFPDTWGRTACELADQEYAASSDWEVVRAEYATKGLLGSRTLVDKLGSLALTLDHATVIASRHAEFKLGFETEAGVVDVQVSGTIRSYKAPTK